MIACDVLLLLFWENPKFFKLLRSAPLSTMRHTCVQSVWLVGYNRVNRLFCQHVYGSPLTLQAGIQHWLNCIEKKQNTWLQCNAVHCIGEQCNVEYLAFNWEDPPNKNMCSNRILLPNSVPPPSSKWTLYGNYFSQKLVNSILFWPPTFFLCGSSLTRRRCKKPHASIKISRI